MKQNKRFVLSRDQIIRKWPKWCEYNMKSILELIMLHFERFFERLWKATIAGNFYKKDKAEILRLLIFAFTIIVVIIISRS